MIPDFAVIFVRLSDGSVVYRMRGGWTQHRKLAAVYPISAVPAIIRRLSAIDPHEDYHTEGA